LRSALQGDSFLRDALIERNEALSYEIRRLQKSSVVNLEAFNFGVGEIPPSLNNGSPEYRPVNVQDRWNNGLKKNRQISTPRKGNEIPRTAVRKRMRRVVQIKSLS
jgi:hypothetical protein